MLISCQDRRSILKEIVRDIDIPLGGTVIYGLITYLYKDGELVYQLESNRFINFTETGNMEFTNIDYKEMDGQNSITSCQAEHVTYTEANKFAYLDNAILKDDIINVEAKELSIDFASEFIYGKYINIISDQQSVKGDSLKYDLVEKHIEISSNVRGSYDYDTQKTIPENLSDKNLSN